MFIILFIVVNNLIVLLGTFVYNNVNMLHPLFPHGRTGKTLLFLLDFGVVLILY